MSNKPQVITNPNYVETSGPTKLDLIQTGDPTRPIYVKYCHSEADAIMLEAAHTQDDWLHIKRVGNTLYLTPPQA